MNEKVNLNMNACHEIMITVVVIIKVVNANLLRKWRHSCVFMCMCHWRGTGWLESVEGSTTIHKSNDSNFWSSFFFNLSDKYPITFIKKVMHYNVLAVLQHLSL